jgi:hypothetical protein
MISDTLRKYLIRFVLGLTAGSWVTTCVICFSALSDKTPWTGYVAVGCALAMVGVLIFGLHVKLWEK